MSLPPLFASLSKEAQGTITGCMLGDGYIGYCIRRNGGLATNARYAMTMITKSKPYLLSLFDNVFGVYSGTGLIPFPNLSLPQHVNKHVVHYYFATLSNELFSQLHSIWYVLDLETKRYVKIVPLFIEELLTPLAIAHWIMQDGYFDNARQTVFLCTEGFTKSESLLLVNRLRKHNIKTSLVIRNKSKDTYRIRVAKKSIPELRKIVLPHMHPIFLYKLGL